MDRLTLKAEIREAKGKQVTALRETGKIPAVLYGHGLETKSIMVNAHELEKTYQTAGTSTLLDLQINGDKSVPVLIHDLQQDIIKHSISHVDFYQVNMTEKITAEVALVFTGESIAVKGLGGTLITSVGEIEVKCLPTDLIHEIVVNLSLLNNFGDKITVKDLPIPASLEVLTEPDVVVATVVAPHEEKEEPIVTETVEAAPVEGEQPVEAAVEEKAKTTK